MLPASAYEPAYAHDNGLTERWRGAVDAFKADATAAWPREACGVVDRDGRYVAVPNVASEPLVSFQMPDDTVARYDPVAVLHSHTSVPLEDGREEMPKDCPSAADMVSQAVTAVPWGIFLVVRNGAADPFWFGDQVPRPPLLGRQFKHGVTDCYSLIRDWHAEVPGIKIPDYPRDDEWWESGETLYDQFEDAGFTRRTRGDNILPGDVFLASIRSPVMNHGGVYIGDGLILHHVYGHLSARVPASVWRSRLNFIVRHRDLPEEWRP